MGCPPLPFGRCWATRFERRARWRESARKHWRFVPVFTGHTSACWSGTRNHPPWIPCFGSATPSGSRHQLSLQGLRNRVVELAGGDWTRVPWALVYPIVPKGFVLSIAPVPRYVPLVNPPVKFGSPTGRWATGVLGAEGPLGSTSRADPGCRMAIMIYLGPVWPHRTSRLAPPVPRAVQCFRDAPLCRQRPTATAFFRSDQPEAATKRATGLYSLRARPCAILQ